ncbi:integrase core domain-containing protein, partial [Micromonospora aurantiaca]|uniref:integrase core domain-containing protein n=1 Tax=Micromonospora aurantiaca (nom. illeg.) TaxID=47850 RepID=UPI0011CDF21E
TSRTTYHHPCAGRQQVTTAPSKRGELTYQFEYIVKNHGNDNYDIGTANMVVRVEWNNSEAGYTIAYDVPELYKIDPAEGNSDAEGFYESDVYWRLMDDLGSKFRTLKCRPDFPDGFGSIQDARAHCRAFFTWYDTIHRHSGIGWHTPNDVHTATPSGCARSWPPPTPATPSGSYAPSHNRPLCPKPRGATRPRRTWLTQRVLNYSPPNWLISFVPRHPPWICGPDVAVGTVCPGHLDRFVWVWPAPPSGKPLLICL